MRFDTGVEGVDGVDGGDRLDFESLYHPLFASDIAGARVSAPPFLFVPLLRSRTLTMISAEPFTGKTLFMLAMLLSLDTLHPLLGYPPASGHRSLFIGQDAPTWDYHGQFLKLFYGLSLPLELEKSTVLPSLFLLNRGFSLLDTSFTDMLSQAVSLYGISVLFLDTLLEFHNLDENSNRDMKHVMGALKHARDRFGLTIFFSHHTSKLSTYSSSAFGPRAQGPANPLPGNALPISRNAAARGASVIGGSVDAHLALRALGTDPSGSPLVELSFPKGRGLDNANPLFFSISPVSRPDKTPALSLRPPLDISSSLLLFLSSPSPRSAIIPHLSSCGFSLSDSSLSRLLSSLEGKGLIHSPTHGVWERTLENGP